MSIKNHENEFKQKRKPSKPKKSKAARLRAKKRINTDLLDKFIKSAKINDEKIKFLETVSPKVQKMKMVCEKALKSVDNVDLLNKKQRKSYDLLKSLDFQKISTIINVWDKKDKLRIAIGYHIKRLKSSDTISVIEDNRTKEPVKLENLTVPFIPKKKRDNLKRNIKDLSAKGLRSHIKLFVKEEKKFDQEKLNHFLSTVEPWRSASWKYVTSEAKEQLKTCENITEYELEYIAVHLQACKRLVNFMKRSTDLENTTEHTADEI